MSSSNRISRAARLFVLLALFSIAFSPVFAQEAVPPAAPATVPAVTATAAVQPVLSFYEDASDADKAAVASSRAFTASGKWLSAWKLLDGYDASNANPWILAEKIRIADEGFAQTIMHLVFGFVDLAEGEDLASARANSGEGVETIDFKPAELAAAIEASGAAVPAVLSLTLGDYYYEVYSKYKGQWMEEDAAILGKAAEEYGRAFAYEAFTRESLGRQSEILISLQQFEGAEAVVRKGLELSPGNHALTLKLGEVLYGAGRYEEVFPLANGLIANPGDSNELNEAFILAIKTGLGTQNRSVLDKYLADYEKGFPGEYMPGLVRHLVMVRLGDAPAADAAADALDLAFPGNPDVIRSVLSTWLSADDTESGFNYLNRCLARNPSDEASAALYFYKALLGYQSAAAIENVEAALADLATAEASFQKVYPAEAQVFVTIAQLRDEWTQALNSAKEGQAVTVPAADAAVQPAASVDVAPAQPAEGGADATSAASSEE